MIQTDTKQLVESMERQGLITRDDSAVTDKELNNARSKKSYYRNREKILAKSRERYAAKKDRKESIE